MGCFDINQIHMLYHNCKYIHNSGMRPTLIQNKPMQVTQIIFNTVWCSKCLFFTKTTYLLVLAYVMMLEGGSNGTIAIVLKLHQVD